VDKGILSFDFLLEALNCLVYCVLSISFSFCGPVKLFVLNITYTYVTVWKFAKFIYAFHISFRRFWKIDLIE